MAIIPPWAYIQQVRVQCSNRNESTVFPPLFCVSILFWRCITGYNTLLVLDIPKGLLLVGSGRRKGKKHDTYSLMAFSYLTRRHDILKSGWSPPSCDVSGQQKKFSCYKNVSLAEKFTRVLREIPKSWFRKNIDKENTNNARHKLDFRLIRLI